MANIHMIHLGMVNVFLIQDQGYILVDTGMKNHGPIILEKLKALGVEPEEIKLIVLTHGHEDHIGGLEFLRAKTKAKVLLHKNEYAILMSEIDEDTVPIAFVAKLIFKLRSLFHIESEPFRQSVDFLMDDEFDLSFFGISGKAVYTPGHTKGSISVIVGDQAVIGDTLMAMMPWSKPGRPILANNLEQVKQSMEKLIQLGVKHFNFSHGKDYSLSEIQNALDRF